MVHEKIIGNLSASFRDEFVNLSSLESDIQKHFETVKLKKPHLTDGELLVYKESEVSKDHMGNINLSCIKGRYSLYLYLNDHPNTDIKYQARTIAPVGIMITTDNYFAFGVMGENTSLPGKILAPGGAIDLNDIKGDYVNILGCMERELEEEIGLDAIAQSKLVTPISLFRSKERHALAIIYGVHLLLDRKQLEDNFREYTTKLIENKREPELSDLAIVPNNQREVTEFSKKSNVIDYIPGALDFLTHP